MTTTKTIVKLAAVLGAAGVAATAATAVLAGKEAALNVGVGYASAAMVMLASARSYARAVQRAVEARAVTYDLERDVIDRQEDPYGLYDETPAEPPADIKEAVAEEKARLEAEKRSFGEMIRDSRPAFSPYRLLAYVALAAGFMYLHGRGVMALPYYLGALALPLLVSVAFFARAARKLSASRA